MQINTPRLYTQLGTQRILDEEVLANLVQECHRQGQGQGGAAWYRASYFLTRTILEGLTTGLFPTCWNPLRCFHRRLAPPWGLTSGFASWTSDSRCTNVCRPIRLIARGLCPCVSSGQLWAGLTPERRRKIQRQAKRGHVMKPDGGAVYSRGTMAPGCLSKAIFPRGGVPEYCTKAAAAKGTPSYSGIWSSAIAMDCVSV